MDLEFGNELRFGVGFGGFGVVWCGLGSGLVEFVEFGVGLPWLVYGYMLVEDGFGVVCVSLVWFGNESVV